MKYRRLIALALVAMLGVALGLPQVREAVAGKPTPVTSVYDVSVTGAANVLTSSVTADADHALRLMIGITPGSSASAVDLVLDDGSGADLKFTLNDGTDLGAGEFYTFQPIIPDGWSWNVSPQTTTRLVVVGQEVHDGL